MKDILQIGLLGLGTGSLYVLLAIGIVLVFRASGVVNFAHGAFGMAGTCIWWDITQKNGLPFLLGLVIGIGVSAALGVITYFFVMRPLAGASSLTRVVATLAVLVIVQSVASLRYGSTGIIVPSTLPNGAWSIFGLAVGADQVLIFLIVIALVTILFMVYRYTQFGRSTSAVAENPRAAAALGVSHDRVAALNWGIGGGLAGLAGILLVPIVGLNTTQLTLLVIPALGAAMVGGLKSFPLTLLGGLVIGLAQSEIGRFVDVPGLAGAVPFIVVAVILIMTGRSVPRRNVSAARLPSIGSGRVRPMIVVAWVAAYAVVVLLIGSPAWIDALTIQLTIAVMLLSLVVVTGYAGQLSLAQFAFAGFGALVAGRLVAVLHLPFPLALLIGVVAVLPLGVVVGMIGLRVRGPDLAVLTLLLGVALQGLLFTNSEIVGGFAGTNVGSPTLFGLNIGAIVYPARYALVALVFFVLTGLAVANLRRGRVGRRLISVRSNERAAASLGISVMNVKVYAFALSAMIAALGGVLYAFRVPNINFGQFDAFGSISLVQDAVVGGIGWNSGALIGSTLFPGAVGTQILDLFGNSIATYLGLIGGVLLLLTLMFAQHGLAPLYWQLIRSSRLAFLTKERTRIDLPDRAPRSIAETPKTLTVRNLTVRFGGVTALSGASLEIGPGEIVGLIGPNGAGKSTLIDAVTGFVRQAGGTIALDDVDVSTMSSARRARAGLGRSFQSLELFDDMNVLDNLRAASDATGIRYYVTDFFRPGKTRLNPPTIAAVHDFDLATDLLRLPGELSYGQRRLVAVARAVAAEPSVLLLDEPAAGLDDQETAELGVLIRELARDWGMAILLVEHDVDLVMRTCDRVYALNFGEVIASGTPSEVRANPIVISAYLGTERHEQAIQETSDLLPANLVVAPVAQRADPPVAEAGRPSNGSSPQT